jgi:hypothetical protein
MLWDLPTGHGCDVSLFPPAFDPLNFKDCDFVHITSNKKRAALSCPNFAP